MKRGEQLLPLTKAPGVLTDVMNGLAQPVGFDWPYVATREVGTGVTEGLGTSEDGSLRTG